MTAYILPTIVSLVLIVVLGALWYSPVLFGKRWAASLGRTEEDFDMKPLHYGLVMATWLVSSISFSALVAMTGYSGLASMICLAVVAFLGFTLTPLMLANIFESRPNTVTVLSIGYHLVAYLIMALVHTIL